MRTVTRDEFFKALETDKRDIMPTTEEPERTLWRDQRTREVFGVTTPGWRNPEAERSFRLVGEVAR